MLGVDFGSHSLKLSEVERGPLGPVIRTFGVTNYLKDRNQTPDLVGTLQELASKTRARSRDVLLSLDPLDVFVVEREVDWRVGDDKGPDEKAVRDWQTYFKRELTKKMINRSAILPLRPLINRDDGVASFSFAMVPNQVLDSYEKIFSAADLNLVGLQYSPHALGRGLAGEGRSVILEMGANSSAWYLFDNGHLRQRTNLAYGGAALSEALALAHGWPIEKAEEHKRSLSGSPDTWPPTTRLVVQSFLRRWWQDLLSGLAERPGFINRIFVVGGGSRLTALRESVFDNFGILPASWSLPRSAHAVEELREFLDPQLPLLANSLASLVAI